LARRKDCSKSRERKYQFVRLALSRELVSDCIMIRDAGMPRLSGYFTLKMLERMNEIRGPMPISQKSQNEWLQESNKLEQALDSSIPLTKHEKDYSFF